MKTSLFVVYLVFASLGLSFVACGGGGSSCKNKYNCYIDGFCRKSCGNTNNFCYVSMSDSAMPIHCTKDSDCAAYACKPCSYIPDKECPNI